MNRGYVNVAKSTRARMQAVRVRNTEAELRVRRVLHALGYRFRLHDTSLPGTPDIVLPRHRKVVLVHGCFWHGHPRCKRAKLPRNNAATWRVKVLQNRARDKKKIIALRELGWDVLILWECETKTPTAIADLAERFFAKR